MDEKPANMQVFFTFIVLSFVLDPFAVRIAVRNVLLCLAVDHFTEKGDY